MEENLQSPKQISLADLAIGKRARVLRLNLSGLERRRLMDLGFTPGAEVEAVMRAAFGEPIAFRVRETLIALRRLQTEMIFAEPL